MLFGVLGAGQVSAGAYISTDNTQLRHHLQILADNRILNTPVAAWPLNWSNVKRALDQVDKSALSRELIWSYRYVLFELERQTATINATVSNFQSTSTPAFTDYSRANREESELSAQVDVLTKWLSLNFEGSYVSDPIGEEKTFRYDGAYAALVAGNWSLGAGALERWWGPGWQNSLILSNNARPAPGIFVRRNYDDAIGIPVLNVLGPWQFELFANKLESDRTVDDAYFYGGRLSLRPLPFLELGFSQTGFEGADSEDLVIDAPANIPRIRWGNQIAAMDLKVGWALGKMTHGAYFQLTGDSETPFMLEDTIGMFGYEWSFSTEFVSNRFIVEYANTIAGGLLGEEKYDVAYRNNTYIDGYTFYGRNMGAAIGADSESVTLLGQHYFSNAWEIEWKLMHADLNVVDEQISSGFSPRRTENLSYVDVSFTRLISERLRGTLRLHYVSDEKTINNVEFESGASVSLSYRY